MQNTAKATTTTETLMVMSTLTMAKTTAQPISTRSRPMRKLLPVALSLLALSFPAHADEPFFAGDETILFIGDSITQDGRFIAYLQAFLDDSHPDHQMVLLNFGLSSETVSGTTENVGPRTRPHVFNRLGKILSYKTPDVTFLCYGMNDGGYRPRSKERFAAYTFGMTRLIGRVAATGSRIVLLTPPPFDVASSTKEIQPASARFFDFRHPYENYAETIRDYAAWLRGQLLNDKIDVVIPVNEVLSAYIGIERTKDATYIYGDGVHPGEDAHFVWAQLILEKLSNPESVTALQKWRTPEFQERWEKALRRHKAHSLALRRFAGIPGEKDPSVIGDRARLDAALVD